MTWFRMQKIATKKLSYPDFKQLRLIQISCTQTVKSNVKN